MATSLEGGKGSASRPGRSLCPRKTLYPLYRRLGGPQGRSRQVRKISPPPGFDPRTVQPVTSRYTDYTTRPTKALQYITHIPLATLMFIYCLYKHSVADPSTLPTQNLTWYFFLSNKYSLCRKAVSNKMSSHILYGTMNVRTTSCFEESAVHCELNVSWGLWLVGT
jgi:hypothetical protein